MTIPAFELPPANPEEVDPTKIEALQQAVGTCQSSGDLNELRDMLAKADAPTEVLRIFDGLAQARMEEL